MNASGEKQSRRLPNAGLTQTTFYTKWFLLNSFSDSLLPQFSDSHILSLCVILSTTQSIYKKESLPKQQAGTLPGHYRLTHCACTALFCFSVTCASRNPVPNRNVKQHQVNILQPPHIQTMSSTGRGVGGGVGCAIKKTCVVTWIPIYHGKCN